MNPLRIAFVSSHPSPRRYRRDASYIYRCENLGLALSEMGHQVSLLHLTALLFRRNFDVVVFMRPATSRLFDFIADRLSKQGVLLIGDADDLIFDPASAEFRPSVRNNLSDLVSTRDKFISHASALRKMDKLQFSTNELAQRYLTLHPTAVCTVIPNAAHRSWRLIAPASVSPDRFISYFSGTRTHDRDFSLVAPALERVLARHADVQVKIVGPVAGIFDHPRIIRLEKVLFKDYAKLVRAGHICIAPLEDTPFNRCKSALKAIEAGMMNVPTVASPIGDYSGLSVVGVLHASSVEEWESQLEFALERKNYSDLSVGLRQRMNSCFDVDVSAQRFLDFAVG